MGYKNISIVDAMEVDEKDFPRPPQGINNVKFSPWPNYNVNFLHIDVLSYMCR
jgi:hypothetical protein